MSRRLLVAVAMLAVTACEDPAGSSLASRETQSPPAIVTTAPTTPPVRVTPRPTATKAVVVTPKATPPKPKPTTAAPRPVATTAKPKAALSTCGAPANPWGYNFCGRGSVIYDPPATFCNVFDCIPSFWENTNGYVMQCDDGMFSHSGGRSGSCSHHGGNNRPLYG